MKKLIKHIKFIFSTILLFIGFSLTGFSQLNGFITLKNDSIVEINEKYKRNDGTGEAIIIERKINDSIADKWLKEYISKTRKKVSNYLKGTKASGCSNLDFENGNFTNWICQVGLNFGYPAGGWSGTAPVVNRHTIVSAGLDPFGGFPMLAPGGGNFSVKLGSTLTNHLAEQLIYTFIVQPQDTVFIYKYAVVFEDPNHPQNEQPYFELKIVDGNDSIIPCSFQHYVAGGNIPGFYNNGTVWYKPWTTVGVNLSSYIGQTVTVIVTAADCSQGGHFGYGYIDFICPSSFSSGSNPYTYCENITSATLNIPDIDLGMSFHWSTGDTTATITINPQLYDSSSISCYIEPLASPGCGFWYVFPIIIIHSPQLSILPANPVICYGQTSTIITSIVSGGIPPYTYLWNTGATTSSITAGAGTYTLLVSDVSGCQPSSASTTVSIFPQQITANAGVNQTICNTSSSINLSGSVTGATGGIWSGGNGNFSPSNTSLNATYYPTTNEITNGSLTLTLTTTGNSVCPEDSDSVTITFVQFNENTSINSVDVLCYGNSTGSATINITNGNPPYTFLWNTTPQQTTQTATNLSQGNYSVTITNVYGCSNIENITINEPQPLTAIALTNNTSCYGTNDGSIVITPFGGTPGYSYNWSNGSNAVSISNLYSGNYTCTITDAHGCTFIINSTITSPIQLTASINNFINVQCYGGTTGSASVSTSGGTPGYNYFWSNNAGTSPNAIGLTSGIYYVTVSDINGCSTTTSVQITQPTAININSTTTNTTCYGGNNGSATVTVTGGTPGYMYSWSPYGGNNATANGLIAGNYVLTVTDSRGCQQTIIAIIAQPPQLTVSLNNFTNVQCYGGTNGSASVSVTGGTPGYTYQWTPFGGNSSVATGLSAGNYTVSITDANSCLNQITIFINQPSTNLSATYNQTNVGCYGVSTGSITANPFGGTPPYSYIWQPNGLTTQIITDLTSGNYFVTITDANGCFITNSITISQPGGILISNTTLSPTCGSANGAISLTPTGGTPGYTYNWMPGGLTTQNITNISSGIYYVTVTDALGCSQISTITLNDASSLLVTMSTVQNVSCFGGNDGSASVNVIGGTPPYTYSWSPYGGSTSTATGLSAGIFIVSVADAAGCISLVATNPEITQPTAFSITSTQNNITCNGANNGSINLSVSGGTPPYTYLWSTTSTSPSIMSLSPGTYTVTVTDFNNCTDTYFVNIVEPNILNISINPYQNISCFGGNDGSATAIVSGGTPPYNFLWSPGGSTSQIAIGFTTGNHTVFVTDSKGCSGSASIFLSQPPIMSLITGFENPTCFSGNNGLAWVVPSGGTPPYNYNWTPIGGTNDTANNLQAGIYYITVTDQNSCSHSVPINISQPQPVVASIVNYTNISCNNGVNGTATVSVTGGTPAYQYNWSNGSTSSSISGVDNSTYFVTVTDANGCSDTSVVNIFEPSQPLNVTITSQNVSCNGFNNGVASCLVSGGTPPYSFIWVPVGQFTSTATNLIAGTYTVSITDFNGCQIFQNISINEPTELNATATQTLAVYCYGSNTGSASVTAWGGTPPFNYNWNTIPTQTTQNATNIFAGNYYVTVTDDNGCNIIDSVIISQPTLLTGVIISTTDVSCHNGSNGIATIDASGGTPPYNFLWGTTPQHVGPSVSGLSAGVYIVTITDNNNCTTTISVTINNASQIVSNIIGQNVICLGNSTTLTANATGGSGNYIYFWTQGLGYGNVQTISPLNTTTYEVFAYDQNGCISTGDTITIYVKTFKPQDVAVIVNSPICEGTSTTVYATAVASTFDTLTYSWNNGLGPGLGPFTLTPLQETTYILTVTNTCGITIIDSARVYFAPPPTIYFITNITQGCVPITVNITDSSYSQFDDLSSWTWNFGDGTYSNLQNPSHTYNAEGTYYISLNIQTTSGCVSNSINYPLPIYVFPNPDAIFTVNSNTLHIPNDPAICYNNSTGAITYLWNFGDGTTSTQQSPTHNYSNIGEFTITLLATNLYGCVDSASTVVNATGDIVFPNAFTPDVNNSSNGEYDPNDLTNHIFFPFATGIKDFYMQIFNRWGELIFETNNIYIGWNGYYRGKLCQEDVYIYKAKASFIDGKTIEKIGDILLLK